jgi:hypothetical protein
VLLAKDGLVLIYRKAPYYIVVNRKRVDINKAFCLLKGGSLF